MAHGSRPRGHVDTKSTPPDHEDPQRRPDLPRDALTALGPAGALVCHVIALPAGASARRSAFLRAVPL
ncbi:uncharacterized protein PGTG_22506 [Puccinia graminis f. sp. tritici CRL 75-36-700-3]|uniref:Uncharacterized protein n=1 Tax=Puccinia graminis f. sp. tritici (strain CRL 75-36-700-3 / race SCCL) TaxID=418459 RepID=H6QUS1_PUCGT|nr:uncharacterized protein PGTG_22506 [Puccinia graminis f. sp. tritici CRL 75-36-700-3]EHS64829.1 hypothetical protein PGTG_22506 [Puccinia graminis f. sp. tritici CRL 75-36-700-3]